MANYNYFLFDLYNTLVDDSFGLAEREQYRLDNIFTILEKSLYPLKYKDVQTCYREMILHMADKESAGSSFSPFYQVDYLLKLLNVHDLIVFKKVYDSYVDAVLQISPKLVHNAARALEELKDRGKKIGLVSNTGKTPGTTLRMLLKQLGIFDYFDDMTFSDEVGFLKPEGVIFQIALRKLFAKPQETIFIGDRQTSDIEGAKNAGISAHLFKKEEEDLFQIVVGNSGDIV